MEELIDIEKGIIKYDSKDMIIIEDNKGKIWFMAKQIALLLDYTNSKKAIRDNVDEEDKETYGKIEKSEKILFNVKNVQTQTIFINESGLYSLMLRSKMEKAKKFKRWVTEIVIRFERYYP